MTSTGRLTGEKKGQASRSFATSSFGMHLDSTLYGQQAKILDTSGVLASMTGLPAANIVFIDPVYANLPTPPVLS